VKLHAPVEGETDADKIADDGTILLNHPILAPPLSKNTAGQIFPIGGGGIVRYNDREWLILPPGLPIITKDKLCVRLGVVTDDVGMMALIGTRSPPPTPDEIAKSNRENGCDGNGG
jgi:hypothetical protein